ncbi:unnamed protein product [Calicophoron daubneyi]|uniref:Uncharacterized protein n=1 Tax=Calicophoron daubneyi TaxID=300641 RepID=A0AAV2TCU6_CALDB
MEHKEIGIQYEPIDQWLNEKNSHNQSIQGNSSNALRSDAQVGGDCPPEYAKIREHSTSRFSDSDNSTELYSSYRMDFCGTKCQPASPIKMRDNLSIPKAYFKDSTVYQAQFRTKDVCKMDPIRRKDSLAIHKGVFANSTLYRTDYAPVTTNRPPPIKPRDNLVVGESQIRGTFFRRDGFYQRRARSSSAYQAVDEQETTEI